MLQEFSLEIKHIKGKNDVITDALVRSENLSNGSCNQLGSVKENNLCIFFIFLKRIGVV